MLKFNHYPRGLSLGCQPGQSAILKFLITVLASLACVLACAAGTAIDGKNLFPVFRLKGSSDQVEAPATHKPNSIDWAGELFVELFPNPSINAGETKTFAASFPGPSVVGWRILNPSNVEIATNFSPGGWNVVSSLDLPAEMTITAPVTAIVGTGYRAECQQSVYGAPGGFYLVFDVQNGTSTTFGVPQNLKAKALDTKVRLEWDTVSGASSYIVRRSLTSGSGYSTLASGVATTNFLDTGLTNGTAYYYVVHAVSGSLQSNQSNEASATPQAMGGPLGIPINPPNGILPNPLALPEWMDHLIPLSMSDAPAGGSASGTAVSLPYGVVIQNNGTDVVGRNPVGSDIAFSRTYRSTLAVANISSPGLPRGWTHNWDYKIISTNNDAWVPLYLMYPNGAYDLLTPVMDDDEPTGEFTMPTGCPYTIEGDPDLGNEGEWNSLTIVGNRSIRKKFQRIGSETVYRLKEIIEFNDAKKVFAYDSGKLTSVTGSKPNFLSYSLLSFYYSASGGFLSSVNANGDNGTYFLYTNGQISGVVSKNGGGNAWGYTYTDISGSPFLSSVSTLGSTGGTKTTTLNYDQGNGRANTYTDSNGIAKTIDYYTDQADESSIYSGLPTQRTNTKFDILGRMTEFTDNAGFDTDIEYSGSLPSKIATLRLPIKGNMPYRGEIAAQYDSHGNQTLITYPDGTSTATTWAYPTNYPEGRVTGSVYKDANQSAQEVVSVAYYATTNGSTGALEGQVESVTVNGETVTYKYTLLGNVKSVHGTGANGAPASMVYDYLSTGQPANEEELGMVKKATDPIGRITTYNYDSLGRLISAFDPIGRKTEYTYNNYHQVTEAESLGRSILWEYPVGNKPAQAVKYDDDLTLPGSFTLFSKTFDNEYGLNAFQTQSQTATLQKDLDYSLNNLTNGNGVKMHEFIDQPDQKRHVTSIGVGTRGTIWTSDYDNYGNVTKLESNMTYSTFISESDTGFPLFQTSDNKLVTSGPTNTTNKSWLYDSSSRLTSGSRGNGLTGHINDYVYDNDGYLQSDTQGTVNTHDYSKVQYVRNGQGLVTNMLVNASTDTLQMEYVYTYNAIGWVTQIQVKRGGSYLPQFSATYQYDDAGRVTAVRTPVFTTLYEYDNFDQVTKVSNLSADGDLDPAIPTQYRYQEPSGTWHTIFSKFENFTYNAYSERTGMSYVMRKSNTPQFVSGTIGFGYLNHRLTSESYTQTGKAGVNYTHTYDAVDNHSVLRGNAVNRDNNSDQITSIPAFSPNHILTYDPNGDLTSFGGDTFEFDSTQMLTKMTAAFGAGSPGGPLPPEGLEEEQEETPGVSSITRVYTYDHNDLRRSSVNASNANDAFYYGYDGSSLVWQKRTNWEGSTMVYYLWGPTGPVMEYSSTHQTTKGFTYDPQGSLVSRVEDYGYGQLHDGARLYDAYGKELWADPASSDETVSFFPFRWKGRFGYVSDYETGLVYCWHRYYSPDLGRWISRDPIGLNGGINTYAYCGGNPVMLIDPSGLLFDDGIVHWWEFEFSGSVWKSGLMTSFSALGSSLSFGIWDGGKYKNQPGFGESMVFWEIAGAALSGGGGPAKAGAAKGLKVTTNVLDRAAISSMSKAQLLALNKQVGKAGEDMLHKMLGGGVRQFAMKMDGKVVRYVDVLLNRVAHESKVGHVKLTSTIRKQIETDAKLIRSKQIKGAEWHFYRSPTTGKIGLDEDVKKLLDYHGIKYHLHD